jgi:hypothetical protein
MPIDEALELLEGAPDNILKEPLEIPIRISETIEELQEKYADKFKICKDEDTNWLNIESLNNSHKDIRNEGNYKLEYSIDLSNPANYLTNCWKMLHLMDKKDIIWQSVFYAPKIGFIEFVTLGMKFRRDNIGDFEKMKLEKWFKETEEFITKEIPELEEFVKNYNAN